MKVAAQKAPIKLVRVPTKIELPTGARPPKFPEQPKSGGQSPWSRLYLAARDVFQRVNPASVSKTPLPKAECGGQPHDPLGGRGIDGPESHWFGRLPCSGDGFDWTNRGSIAKVPPRVWGSGDFDRDWRQTTDSSGSKVRRRKVECEGNQHDPLERRGIDNPESGVIGLPPCSGGGAFDWTNRGSIAKVPPRIWGSGDYNRDWHDAIECARRPFGNGGGIKP